MKPSQNTCPNSGLQSLDIVIRRDFRVIQGTLDKAGYSKESKKKVQQSLSEIDAKLSRQIHFVFQNLSEETFLLYPKFCVETESQLDRAQFYLDHFLEYSKSKNHFQITALVLSAKICNILLQDKNLDLNQKKKLIQKSLCFFQQAVQIIDDISRNSEKPKEKKKETASPGFLDKYKFLIYNLSHNIYELMRQFYREDQMILFKEMVIKIYELLKDNVHFNLEWKSQFTWIFFNSIYFSEPDKQKQQVHLKILDSLWNSLEKDLTKEQRLFKLILFRQRVFLAKDFNSYKEQIRKEIEKDKREEENEWRFLFQVFLLKSGQIPSNMVEKEINNLISEVSKAQMQGSKKDKKNDFFQIQAEIARVAIKHGSTQIASILIQQLKLTNQKNRETCFLMELISAELMVCSLQQDEQEDVKKLSQTQIKEINTKKRKEAIDIVLNALKQYKKLQDPALFYEASLLIWNISLPFLNDQYEIFLENIFIKISDILELMNCNDYELRINFLYEIGRMNSQPQKLSQAQEYAEKALELSNYTNDYQKRKIQDLIIDLQFKQKSFNESFFIQHQGFKKQFEEMLRIKKKIDEILLKKQERIAKFELRNLVDEMKAVSDVRRNEDGMSLREEDQSQRTLKRLKKKTYFDILKIVGEHNLFDLILEVGHEILEGQEEEEELAITVLQIQTLFVLIQSKIQYLSQQNFPFAFVQESQELANTKNEEYKSDIYKHFNTAISRAKKSKQNWLVFNVGILLWNNFLPTFKNSTNDKLLHGEVEKLLKFMVESFIVIIKEIESDKIVDYDQDKKIQVFGNITIIYCRLLETKGLHKEVKEVCESLLLQAISKEMRKLVHSIRSKTISKLEENEKKNAKGNNMELKYDKNEQLQMDIIYLLENIQNSGKSDEKTKMLKDSFLMMTQLTEQSKDKSIQSCVMVELWTKLANLALLQASFEMTKFSLICLEKALNMKKEYRSEHKTILDTKWLCFAEFLFSKACFGVAQVKGIEAQNKTALYFTSLKFLIKSNGKAIKSGNKKIMIQSVGKFFQIVKEIFVVHREENAILLLPKPIFTLFFQIHSFNLAEDDSFDHEKFSQMYINLLNISFYCTKHSLEWKMLKESCDFLLDLVQFEYRIKVWFVKAQALAKLDVSEEDFMSFIREFEPVYQAQLLTQMAFNCKDQKKQLFGLNKALYILKSEKDPYLAEVVLDLCFWMHLHKLDISKIKKNLFNAIHLISKLKPKEASPTTIPKLQFKNYFSFLAINKKLNRPQIENLSTPTDTKLLDLLFRLHVFLGLLPQKQLYSSLYFIDSFNILFRMFQVNVCYLNDQVVKQEKEKDQESNVLKQQTNNEQPIKLPFCMEEWLLFEMSEQMLKRCWLDQDKCLISKNQIHKAEVTFQILLVLFQEFFREGFYFESVFLLFFIEFFEKVLFKKESVTLFCLVFKIQIAKKFNLKEVFPVLELKLTELSQNELFFERIFSDSTKIQQLNINYAEVDFLVNDHFPWQQWLTVADVLIDLHSFSLAEKLIRYYKKISQFNNLSQEVLKSEVAQAKLEFSKGFFDIGVQKLEHCLTFLLDSFYVQSAVEIINQYFLDKKLFLQANELLSQAEVSFQKQLLASPKDNKLQRLIGNVKFQQIRALLQEFEDFSQRFFIEDSKNCQRNFSDILKEVLKKLQEIYEICKDFLTLSLAHCFVTSLSQVFEIFQNLKVVDEETGISLFLVATIAVKQIEQFQNVLGKQVDKLKKFSAYHKTFKTQDQFLELSSVQKILDFLWCKFWNFKQVFSVDYPASQQKQLESHIFQEDVRQDDRRDEQEPTRENKEYPFEKIEAILANTEENRRLFIFKEDIEIEKNVNSNFKSQKSQQINYRNQNDLFILKDLELKFNETEHQKNAHQIKLDFKRDLLARMKSLKISPDEILSESYFALKKKCLDQIFSLQREINEKFDIAQLLGYQEVSVQEKMVSFLKNNSLPLNSKFALLQQAFSRQEKEYFASVLEQDQVLKKIFSFSQTDKFPPHSVFFVIQSDQKFKHSFFCLFYVDQDCSPQILYQEETGIDFILRIKDYYRQTLQNYKQLDDHLEESSESSQQNGSSGTPSSNKPLFLEDELRYGEYIKISEMLEKVENKVLRLWEIKQCQASSDPKAKKPEEQKPFLFDNLFLLIDLHFFDFPFEFFLSQKFHKKFRNVGRFLSLSQVPAQSPNETLKNKSFVSVINPLVQSFEEIYKSVDQLSALFESKIKKSDKQLLGQTEWEQILSNNDLLVLQTNFDVFGFFDIKRAVSTMDSISVKAFFCFDRMKLFEKEFLKFQRRSALEVNYLRSQQFLSLFFLLGTPFALFPRYNFKAEELLFANSMIEAILSNQQDKLRDLVSEYNRYLNFTFIGTLGNLSVEENKKKK